jgi:hypothetical protein
MDGREGAVQPHGLAQFREGQIRLLGQQPPHLLLMGGQDAWLGPGKAVARGNVPGSAALLEQLLDQAEGHPVPAGDFLAVTHLLIIGAQDAFS